MDQEEKKETGSYQTEDYDPNKAYNYERAHAEQEWDDRGHPLPPKPKKPNNLAAAALFCSLATIFLCCCNPYVAILASIMGITLSICSRYFNNEEQRMYPQAVAALVISIIALILILGSIIINYVLVPYLLDTSPEFKEYYNQMMKLFMDALNQAAEQE